MMSLDNLAGMWRVNVRSALFALGVPAVVAYARTELVRLVETIDLLRDPQVLTEVREADEAYARGDVVRGVDAVRSLRS